MKKKTGRPCSVCEYMKKHKDFKHDIMHSTYIDPKGTENLYEVNERYGTPIKPVTLYRHMQVHQKRDIDTAERLAQITGEESKNWQRRTVRSVNKLPKQKKSKIDKAVLENTVAVVEEVKLTATQAHEIGLDAFIAMGTDRLKHKEMSISASNYLAAIKIKAEIERTTKDRRLEMLRSMFAGAAPKQGAQ